MKLGILLGTLFTFVVATNGSAAEYKIDPDHSRVGFKIGHLAISTVAGRFSEFSGTFAFDPQNVKASTAKAEIAVTSVNTEQKKRDDHLRSADFFESEKFQKITFDSTEIQPVSAAEFNAKGNLTIRGVTKPVTLNVKHTGSAKDHFGNDRAAFVATTKLDRRDFGLTWNKVLDAGGLVVGNEVDVMIEIEGIKG